MTVRDGYARGKGDMLGGSGGGAVSSKAEEEHNIMMLRCRVRAVVIETVIEVVVETVIETASSSDRNSDACWSSSDSIGMLQQASEVVIIDVFVIVNP